jgi:hypothetical protein
MADTKETTPTHGRDPRSPKEDGGRLTPYTFNEPRPQAEIVAQAYEIETPTPTQEENDQAKKDAMYQDPGSLDPQKAEAKKKQDEERRKQMEAKPAGGYQTRAAAPKVD